MTYQMFQWRDSPITDIELFASERKMRMVDIEWQKKTVNIATGKMEYYYETTTMPECFWEVFRITPDNGTPVKISYRKPKPKGGQDEKAK